MCAGVRLPKQMWNKSQRIIIGIYRSSKLNEVENAQYECTISRSFVYVCFFFDFKFTAEKSYRPKENVKINSIRMKFVCECGVLGAQSWKEKQRSAIYAKKQIGFLLIECFRQIVSQNWKEKVFRIRICNRMPNISVCGRFTENAAVIIFFL